MGRKGNGPKVKKPFCKKWWFWVIILFMGLGSLGSNGGATQEKDNSDTKIMNSQDDRGKSENQANGTARRQLTAEENKQTPEDTSEENPQELIQLPVIQPDPEPEPEPEPASEPTEAVSGDRVQNEPKQQAAEPTPETKAATAPALVSTPASSSGGGSGNANNFNTYDNAAQQQTDANWVLNMNTKKIHYPICSQVKKIAPKNYSTSNEDRSTLISRGYSMCGVCGK